jgi:hypothetical protein
MASARRLSPKAHAKKHQRRQSKEATWLLGAIDELHSIAELLNCIPALQRTKSLMLERRRARGISVALPAAQRNDVAEMLGCSDSVLAAAIWRVERMGTIMQNRLSARCQREEDQHVDRGVFEKVDAVGEQRHLAESKRDGELDAEVREIEDRHQSHGPAQAAVFVVIERRGHALTLSG